MIADPNPKPMSPAQKLIQQFTESVRAAPGPYNSLSTIMSQVPLMHYTAKSIKDQSGKPFEDIHIVMLLHALGNAVALTMLLIFLGADPARITFFYKDYKYKHKQRVLAKLISLGVSVHPVEKCDAVLPGRLGTDQLPIIHIVDGAYPAIAAMKIPDFASRTIGIVEQTRKGIRRLIDAFGKRGPRCPVISIPDSNLKKNFEPPHVARAVLDSIIALLPTVSPVRMNLAVLGVGVIGKEIAEAAISRGCTVSIYDPSPEALLMMSSKSVKLCRSAACAVADAEIVIGASGECSITPDVFAAMKHGVFVVSASSDRAEIDWKYLTQASTKSEPLYRDPSVSDQDGPIGTTFTIGHQEKKIKLIGDGMPLNFAAVGMSDDSADLIMTMLLISAYEIVSGFWKKQRGILPDAMDKIVVRHRIAESYLNLIHNN